MPIVGAATVTACALALSTGGATVPPPVTSLVLTTHGPGGTSSTVHLYCSPAGGTHPRPADACEALSSAEGDFDRLPTTPEACVLIYAPVEATAHGVWRGQPVAFRTTYSNECVADAKSGGVFDF